MYKYIWEHVVRPLATGVAFIFGEHQFAKSRRLQGTIEGTRKIEEGAMEYIATDDKKKKAIAFYKIQEGIGLIDRTSTYYSIGENVYNRRNPFRIFTSDGGSGYNTGNLQELIQTFDSNQIVDSEGRAFCLLKKLKNLNYDANSF